MEKNGFKASLWCTNFFSCEKKKKNLIYTFLFSAFSLEWERAEMETDTFFIVFLNLLHNLSAGRLASMNPKIYSN